MQSTPQHARQTRLRPVYPCVRLPPRSPVESINSLSLCRKQRTRKKGKRHTQRNAHERHLINAQKSQTDASSRLENREECVTLSLPVSLLSTHIHTMSWGMYHCSHSELKNIIRTFLSLLFNLLLIRVFY